MRRAAAVLVAAASFGWFLWDAASRGWSQPTTDFPNYYTAAVLVRKHQPLRRYYEWTWFQRQMNFAGISHQLGGYIPQTPLTMAPFVPLSFFSPPTARKIWFILNVAFLGASLFFISRMTRFSVAELWILALPGYYTLRSNFELGQYYVFLLALLTAALYSLQRKRDLAGGALLGTVMALKIYGAPFLLLLVVRRRWRAVLGLIMAFSLLLVCAIGVFGWSDISFFGTQVLPRALSGETINPYHPSNGTAATLLRRIFLAEAELNPHPWIDSPWTLCFLLTLFTLSITLFPAIAAARDKGAPSKRTLAWWLLGMLLASPNTASYTFVLLVLPVALLMDELPIRQWIWIVLPYFLMTLPLRPAWSWAFPRLWLLLALFLIAGYPELRSIPASRAVLALVVIALVGAVKATVQRDDHFSRAVTEPGAIYSGAPATSPAGLVYESIGQSKYVLRKSGQTFSFDGEAFHPAIPDSGAPVYFELVAGGHSQIMRFDERTGHSEAVPIDAPDPREPATSHDGKTLAAISQGALYVFDGPATRRLAFPARDPSFIPGDHGIVFVADGEVSAIRAADLNSGHVTTLLEDRHDLAAPSVSPDGKRLLFAARRGADWQVWVKDLYTRQETRLTDGSCNSFTPIWNGPREVVFASDCRRGLGLPGLFRTALQ
jgi:hypothetical protein